MSASELVERAKEMHELDVQTLQLLLANSENWRVATNELSQLSLGALTLRAVSLKTSRRDCYDGAGVSMVNNTCFYEDAIEDILDQDPILLQIPEPEQRTDEHILAVRLRRSLVVASLVLYGDDFEIATTDDEITSSNPTEELAESG